MGILKAIYLLFTIYGTFGQMNLQENKALEANNVPSTTSDKVSNVLRNILNQESLVRFSMVQKIQRLVLDVADNKNDIEVLKKKLSDVTKELQTREKNCQTSASTLPKDCKALHDMGRTTSDVYSIYPWDDLPKKSVQVYCDMVTAGGGWTVIQNRVDGKVNFSRNWQEYKVGFGDLSTSHWIGNDIIYQLTKENSSSLYVSITGKNGTTFFIQYDTFSISGEDDHYRLYVAGKTTGTLGDRIRQGTGNDNINGMKFSTYDKDNDLSSSKCTNTMGIGGWWFNRCNDAYLNGPYPPGKWTDPWYPEYSTGSKISSTRMMIRRQ